MFAPNLPELVPHHFPLHERVAFESLTLAERHHLGKLGAEYFPGCDVHELAIYRSPAGITFFAPLQVVRGFN